MRGRREDEKEEEDTLRVQGGYSGVHQGTVGVQWGYSQGTNRVQ